MQDLSRERIIDHIRRIVAEERRPLESISLDDLTVVSEIGEVPEIDLKSLFEALSAMGVELKQMNRLEKQRIEALSSFLEAEQTAGKQRLERMSRLITQNEFQELKPLILGLIELKDFVVGIRSAAPFWFKSSGLLRWLGINPSPTAAITGINQILDKIDRLLEKQDVLPIETTDAEFDPERMMAVEVVEDPTQDDRRVLETIEPGYIRRHQVLRLAKVRVNKNKKTGEQT
jgi:hypothetical protein